MYCLRTHTIFAEDCSEEKGKPAAAACDKLASSEPRSEQRIQHDARLFQPLENLSGGYRVVSKRTSGYIVLS